MSFCAVNNNLLSSVNSLNEMKPWNSWDCQLVKLGEIEKLIIENKETIHSTSDWRLCQSLSDLGRRVSEEPFFSSEAKVLAKIISSLIPVHFYCDPNMPSFISLAPEDVRNNVLVHLEKRELISFSQTSKQMYQVSAKWMPIKTEELLIDLFDLCMANKHQYGLQTFRIYTREAERRLDQCLILKNGSEERIVALRNAFLPLFEDVAPGVIKCLPSCFYEDKLLILDLIKVSDPRISFKYDNSTSNDKFVLAYLELLKEGKVQVSNLDLDMDSIDKKMAHTFADLIRNSGRSWQITLLNVQVKYNFWGSKVIDNAPEGYQVIKTAINEKKYSQLTYNLSKDDESCDYEIYGKKWGA